MRLRYRALLEQRVNEREDGHSVVYIVTAEDTDENQLRFCYSMDGEFIKRPLTISPSQDTAERTSEIVEKKARLAHSFTSDVIKALGGELGEEKILELQVLIEELGRAVSRKFSKRELIKLDPRVAGDYLSSPPEESQQIQPRFKDYNCDVNRDAEECLGSNIRLFNDFDQSGLGP